MEKITVLLVEDEQTLAMIIKDTLEGQNFIIQQTVKRDCASSSTSVPTCWWQT
jgi:DNA-binding response OmpR family regulator